MENDPSVAFYDAVCGNDLVRVGEFLRADPGLANLRFESNTQPLHQAVRGDSQELVELLLRHGADVNGLSYDSMTPLHHACDGERTAIVRVLVASGANLAHRDIHGCSPAVTALRTQSPEGVGIAQLLFDAGAPVGLYEAVCLSDKDRCRAILSQEGPKALTDIPHDDLLLDAIISGRGDSKTKNEIVRMLFDNGLAPSEFELRRAAEWAEGKKLRVGMLGDYLRQHLPK